MRPTPPLNPGDDAPEGTPGIREDVCPRCRGKGKTEDQRACQDCAGSGKIIEGIGGG